MTFLLIDAGTDRELWLAARAGEGRVSATDAARIMTGGAGTWASLRKEKAGDGSDGFRGNAYTRHGNEREPVLAAYARSRFGLEPSSALLARAGSADPALDMATPDALSTLRAGDDEHLLLQLGVEYAVEEFGEFKTTVHDWPTWDDVPKRYHWQVVWQFVVTGAARCRFVFEAHEGFVPLHMEPRHFTIERADVEADMAALQAAVASWRGSDVEDVPEALLPLDALLAARAVAKEDADAAAARVSDVEAEIRELLVAHSQPVKFEGSDANVSWSGKTGTQQRFDSKGFQASYPAAARRFTKTTTTQPRLTITARS